MSSGGFEILNHLPGTSKAKKQAIENSKSKKKKKVSIPEPIAEPKPPEQKKDDAWLSLTNDALFFPVGSFRLP